MRRAFLSLTGTFPQRFEETGIMLATLTGPTHRTGRLRRPRPPSNFSICEAIFMDPKSRKVTPQRKEKEDEVGDALTHQEKPPPPSCVLLRTSSALKLQLAASPDVPDLKHESRILGQWSNPVCGSWKSQASSPWAKQHRALPVLSRRNRIQGWMNVQESYYRNLDQGTLRHSNVRLLFHVQ